MKAVPSFKLTQEGSDIIVNTAIEKAKELKQIVSIAVVDAGGHLFAFKRMTNGRTHNTLLALAKARGAALPRPPPAKPIAKARKSPIIKCSLKHSVWDPAGSSASRRYSDHARRPVHRRGWRQRRPLRRGPADRAGRNRCVWQSLTLCSQPNLHIQPF